MADLLINKPCRQFIVLSLKSTLTKETTLSLEKTILRRLRSKGRPKIQAAGLRDTHLPCPSLVRTDWWKSPLRNQVSRLFRLAFLRKGTKLKIAPPPIPEKEMRSSSRKLRFRRDHLPRSNLNLLCLRFPRILKRLRKKIHKAWQPPKTRTPLPLLWALPKIEP